MYKSVWEIKDATNSTGSYFFSPDTMRYWRTRVMRTLFDVPGGTLFITSDEVGNEGRWYSVRYIDGNARINTLGTWKQYGTRLQALGAAKRIALAMNAGGRVCMVCNETKNVKRWPDPWRLATRELVNLCVPCFEERVEWALEHGEIQDAEIKRPRFKRDPEIDDTVKVFPMDAILECRWCRGVSGVTIQECMCPDCLDEKEMGPFPAPIRTVPMCERCAQRQIDESNV